MRFANLVIMGVLALMASGLAFYTAPVGARSLSHWAMTLGLFSSAAVVSWLFMAVIVLSKRTPTAIQLVVLLIYAIALLCSSVAGASFGVIYHVMDTRNVGFLTALSDAGLIIFIGYGVSVAVFLLSVLLLKKAKPMIRR
ncbi:MAG: hypothetical protein RBR45_09685 [Pseudomonas sp.]|jgi:hypothetical protein|nr:hypothetical protein [Pseudomonas sp.]